MNSHSKYKTIYIHCEYDGVGGAENLKAAVYYYLQKRGYKVHLFAKNNSYVKKRFDDIDDKYEFTDLSVVNDKIDTGTEGVALLFDFGEVQSFTKGSNIIIWQVHPDMFYWSYKSRLQKRLLRFDLKKLLKKRGLFFMSSDIMEIISRLSEKKLPGTLEQPLLFIPSHTLKKNYAPVREGEIHFSFVGRSVPNKINPVTSTLKFMDEYWRQNNIHVKPVMHIVTNDMQAFAEAIEKDYIPDIVELRFVTNKFGNDLHKYLVDHTDVGFASGTSVLDTASSKIPTVLYHGSYELYKPEYAYMLYYDSPKNYLSEYIYSRKDNKGLTYAELFSTLLDEKGRAKIGDAGYAKAYADHISDDVIDSFEEKIQSTKLKVKDLWIAKFHNGQLS